MDILIPLGIGASINTLVFLISILIVRNFHKAIKVTGVFIVLGFIATFILACIINGWFGMGMLVIWMGMLSATIILFIIYQITKHIHPNESL